MTFLYQGCSQKTLAPLATVLLPLTRLSKTSKLKCAVALPCGRDRLAFSQLRQPPPLPLFVRHPGDVRQRLSIVRAVDADQTRCAEGLGEELRERMGEDVERAALVLRGERRLVGSDAWSQDHRAPRRGA